MKEKLKGKNIICNGYMAGSSVIALPVQAPVVMIVTEVLSVRHVMEQGKRRINQRTVTIMSVIERIEKDSLHLFDTKGNWDTEAQDELLKLAKIGQQMQWVSVDEKLPEDGQIVDVWIVSNGLFNQRLTDVVYSSTSLTFQIDDICDVGIESHPTNSFITHWMPLPKPPMGECSDEDLY